MRYTQISIEEMRDKLKLEKGWRESVQNEEVVFEYPLHAYPFIKIKVFSSISTRNNLGRACGGDAIRVCAVNTKTNQGWIKAARVYRVEGWRDNLESRVLEVIDEAKARCRNNNLNQIRNTARNDANLRAESEIQQIEGNQI